MNIKTILIYVVCIGASLLAGIVGSLFTLDQIPGWYAQLVKPSWNPPSWVFGPVWNTLYVLMGIAAARVWTSSKKPTRFAALWLFFAHLVVNALWSVVFFGLHEIALALAIIILMWVLILITVVWFKRYSRAASWLLVPYLLWVSYAFTLNLGILVLN